MSSFKIENPVQEEHKHKISVEEGNNESVPPISSVNIQRPAVSSSIIDCINELLFGIRI